MRESKNSGSYNIEILEEEKTQKMGKTVWGHLKNEIILPMMFHKIRNRKTVLRERSQTQKNTYYMNPFI